MYFNRSCWGSQSSHALTHFPPFLTCELYLPHEEDGTDSKRNNLINKRKKWNIISTAEQQQKCCLYFWKANIHAVLNFYTIFKSSDLSHTQACYVILFLLDIKIDKLAFFSFSLHVCDWINYSFYISSKKKVLFTDSYSYHLPNNFLTS